MGNSVGRPRTREALSDEAAEMGEAWSEIVAMWGSQAEACRALGLTASAVSAKMSGARPGGKTEAALLRIISGLLDGASKAAISRAKDGADVRAEP